MNNLDIDKKLDNQNFTKLTYKLSQAPSKVGVWPVQSRCLARPKWELGRFSPVQHARAEY